VIDGISYVTATRTDFGEQIEAQGIEVGPSSVPRGGREAGSDRQADRRQERMNTAAPEASVRQRHQREVRAGGRRGNGRFRGPGGRLTFCTTRGAKAQGAGPAIPSPAAAGREARGRLRVGITRLRQWQVLRWLLDWLGANERRARPPRAALHAPWPAGFWVALGPDIKRKSEEAARGAGRCRGTPAAPAPAGRGGALGPMAAGGGPGGAGGTFGHLRVLPRFLQEFFCLPGCLLRPVTAPPFDL